VIARTMLQAARPFEAMSASPRENAGWVPGSPPIANPESEHSHLYFLEFFVPNCASIKSWRSSSDKRRVFFHMEAAYQSLSRFISGT
jgi:hypothetical protein